MRKSLLSLSAFFMLSGCGTWPDYGNGGMDEVYAYERSKTLETAHFSEAQSNYQISRHLDDARLKIDHAWNSAAGKYKPYDLMLIDIQWGRVAREFAGHLHQDAAASLLKLKEMMRKLDNDLESLKQKKTVANATAI